MISTSRLVAQNLVVATRLKGRYACDSQRLDFARVDDSLSWVMAFTLPFNSTRSFRKAGDGQVRPEASWSSANWCAAEARRQHTAVLACCRLLHAQAATRAEMVCVASLA